MSWPKIACSKPQKKFCSFDFHHKNIDAHSNIRHSLSHHAHVSWRSDFVREFARGLARWVRGETIIRVGSHALREIHNNSMGAHSRLKSSEDMNSFYEFADI